jgi:hypothetical protein
MIDVSAPDDKNYEENILEGVEFYEYSLAYTYDLWRSEESMSKYIEYFINDAGLEINNARRHCWYTICPKIYDLTPAAVDFLKKEERYKTLFFDESFTDNHKLLTMLPKHIGYIFFQGTSSLTFDEEIELDFTNLPQELIYLDIGYKYKYILSLDHLPAGLKVLRMGDKLDVPIDNLPQGLEILEIGKLFTHSIDNLPDSIKILFFTKKLYVWANHYYRGNSHILYSKKINKLPLGLVVLVFDNVIDEVLCDIDFSYLENLIYLALPYYFDDAEFFNPAKRGKWSGKLKTLHIGKTYNKIIGELPAGLETLLIHQNFDLEENLVCVPRSLKNVLIERKNEIITNDKCHYETFDKISAKFQGLKLGFFTS